MNHYKTSHRKVMWYARKFPGLVFYSAVAYQVVKASRMIKSNNYTNEDFTKGSLETLRALENVGASIEAENLRAFQNLKSPCIFVCNHMSTLETFALPCFIQPYHKVIFVIKESLTKYPVFKDVVNARDPIVVGRVNPREDFRTVMDEGKKRLAQGISIIIFPQTTRSNYVDRSKFNSIGIKLARQAKVPVIPVALKTDAWGIGGPLKDLGKIDPAKQVRFSFGDPIYISGNGKKEHEVVVDFVADKLSSWQEIV